MFHYPALGFDFQAVGMFFLWGALVFTLWSGDGLLSALQKIAPRMKFSVDNPNRIIYKYTTSTERE
jgi:hypothetical protein